MRFQSVRYIKKLYGLTEQIFYISRKKIITVLFFVVVLRLLSIPLPLTMHLRAIEATCTECGGGNPYSLWFSVSMDRYTSLQLSLTCVYLFAKPCFRQIRPLSFERTEVWSLAAPKNSTAQQHFFGKHKKFSDTLSVAFFPSHSVLPYLIKLVL